MRSRLNILVAAAAAILVVPQFATAGSVEDQLQVMNDRMGQLEDQLQATQDELDASTDTVERQGDVIEKAGLARQAKSGLSSFYDQVQISGWLAVSYFFNDNNPDSDIIKDQNWSRYNGYGVNNTTTNLVAPFHPDHNSFSVDQLWFEIEKPVTEESRGGFRADLVWGNTASILDYGHQRLCGSTGDTAGGHYEHDPGVEWGDRRDCIGDEASDFSLYQAYVQYLTPFGPTLKAGKFGTLIGYEVAGTIYNFNVTRGLVYTALQPINHYGILLDGQTDGGIVYGLGVVNDASDAGPDFNNSKHILARLGWAGEKASVLANMLWGNEEYGGRHDPFITADLVATFDPIESLSTWLNFTYKQHMSGGPDTPIPYTGGKPEGWGVAAAARYAINDRLGLALRGEFIQDNRNLFGATYRAGGGDAQTDLDAWGFTLTADYAITDNLTLKAEGRFDRFDFIRPDDPPTDTAVSADGSGGIFERDNFRNRNNWLTGAELVYQF